jgi:hypothetical protein
VSKQNKRQKYTAAFESLLLSILSSLATVTCKSSIRSIALRPGFSTGLPVLSTYYSTGINHFLPQKPLYFPI